MSFLVSFLTSIFKHGDRNCDFISRESFLVSTLRYYSSFLLAGATILLYVAGLGSGLTCKDIGDDQNFIEKACWAALTINQSTGHISASFDPTSAVGTNPLQVYGYLLLLLALSSLLPGVFTDMSKRKIQTSIKIDDRMSSAERGTSLHRYWSRNSGSLHHKVYGYAAVATEIFCQIIPVLVSISMNIVLRGKFVMFGPYMLQSFLASDSLAPDLLFPMFVNCTYSYINVDGDKNSWDTVCTLNHQASYNFITLILWILLAFLILFSLSHLICFLTLFFSPKFQLLFVKHMSSGKLYHLKIEDIVNFSFGDILVLLDILEEKFDVVETLCLLMYNTDSRRSELN